MCFRKILIIKFKPRVLLYGGYDMIHLYGLFSWMWCVCGGGFLTVFKCIQTVKCRSNTPILYQLNSICSYSNILDWLQFKPGYFFNRLPQNKRDISAVLWNPRIENQFWDRSIAFPLWESQSLNQQVRVHFIKRPILIQILRGLTYG